MVKYDLEIVSELMIESIVELLEYFDVKYIDSPKTISFCCPIHGGVNKFGSSILKRDIGNWMCYTGQCHEQYGTSSGASIVQFVQALLSTQYEKEYTFYEALEWCAKFVGEDPTQSSPELSDRLGFIKLVKYINRKKVEVPTFTPRELVRDFLAIPSSYYVKRGYSEAILNKFDIGYCHNEKKPFYDRIVTPFYDDSGRYMVGCSGRVRFDERCGQCNLYHDPAVRCPITKNERLKCVKWRHSTLMNADDYLYNYWNAKEHIMNTGTAILVEGPGDVWRLEEAGIYNSLALLKASLSTGQRMVLESSGAVNLAIATDMDEAGNRGAKSIYEQCKHLFHTVRIKFEHNDPGCIPVEQIKEIFPPILEKL